MHLLLLVGLEVAYIKSPSSDVGNLFCLSIMYLQNTAVFLYNHDLPLDGELVRYINRVLK